MKLLKLEVLDRLNVQILVVSFSTNEGTKQLAVDITYHSDSELVADKLTQLAQKIYKSS